MKKWIRLAFLALVAAVVTVFSSWPDQNLHIIACDVGQGDAILLTRGFWQVLIDGGPNDSVQTCLNQHLPFWDRTIELVVITHFDKDHIGGLPGIFDKFEIKQALISEWRDSSSAQKLKDSIKTELDNGMQLKTANFGRKIEFTSGGSLQILHPQQSVFNAKIATADYPKSGFTEQLLSDNFSPDVLETNNNNDLSIILFLQFGEFNGLLMGDADQKIELALVKQGLIREVDWLKVGHHGAKTSTSLPFLQAARPEICTISCSNSNSFGHPDADIVAKLEQVGCIVWRTDQQATMELVTNGADYWLL